MKNSTKLDLAQLVLFPWLVVYQGWMFTILWAWFAVPVFDAPGLSVAQAIGLTLIVCFLKSRTADKHNEPEDEKVDRQIKSLVAQVFMPVFLVGIGAIVRLFQ